MIFSAGIGCQNPDEAVGGDAGDEPKEDVSADVSREDAGGGDVGSGCVPNREAWDGNTREMVQTSCGQCHGTTPHFGAPTTLLDYEKLLAGNAGE